MTIRNRPYLDMLRGQPCQIRVPGVCVGGESPDAPSVPCHSNLQRHGRGFAHKSHDVYSVPGCPPCHRWLDEGRAAREEKEEAFMSALERWWLYAWLHNLIAVQR